MTSCLHGLPRFARNDNQRAWTAASRFAPRSDETTAYGPYAVFVARNHVHSSLGAPATHAGWWIGRPGVGPIRRCHRACVSITALMSTSRCASSARRRAWARERIPGPPALPHPVEKGVFLRLQRGPVGSGHFLRPHRGPGVRARFRSALLVSGKTLVLNRDLTPCPLPGSRKYANHARGMVDWASGRRPHSTLPQSLRVNHSVDEHVPVRQQRATASVGQRTDTRSTSLATSG